MSVVVLANSIARARHRQTRVARRSGTLMVCVLVCMLVVGSLVALLAKDALSARRETKLRFQAMQTERLLDAGILRATKQSKTDPDYAGETWTPELELAGQPAGATVTITVQDNQTSVTAKLGIAPNITTKSYVYSSSSEL